MSDTVVTTRHTSPPDAPPPAGLPTRVLNRSFWRFFWSFQISWNYERMQALGFCWAIIPVLRYLHRDDTEFAEAMQRHLSFFNTSPVVGGPFILGSTIAMEEGGSAASADGVKVAMMGPLAGIGDAVTYVVYNSIVFTLGANWALQGNVIGPIFVALFVLVPYFLIRRWQFNFGYSQGKALITRLASGALQRVNEGAIILAMIVFGGFIPSIVKIVTTLSYHGTASVGGKAAPAQLVQTQLDGIVPFLIPVALTALIYFLLKKFNLNPIWAIVIVFAIGLTLGGLGWFANAQPSAQ
ncbi:MAG TPA: PTS system mannose/fructose/sorbose family transporter subunit IID [Pseudonocardiaceae bacterium]|jgi:mannose/fructose/N-acetylgalactosamine-specific phosphotransferase system component IID|nr:PTS system mannose/fructose/sorbose family transporter subunit IID [Pseudonocardiaceae bacterium]